MRPPARLPRLNHKALLSEMHMADQLLENHSRNSLVVSMGLLAFATTGVADGVPTLVLVFLGLVVIAIWSFKISRHLQIFEHCYRGLKQIDKNAIRPQWVRVPGGALGGSPLNTGTSAFAAAQC